MRKRDALKIQQGDTIALKHNLGGGEVIRVVEHYNGLDGTHPQAVFPQVQFKQEVIHFPTWACYKAIETWTPKLRSIK